MTSSIELFSELENYKAENKVVKFYDNYAKVYDDATKDAYYNKIVDYSAMFLKNLLLEESCGITVEEFEILDVGCGSGMAGEALQKVGFKHLDGIDASQGMLDIAKEKNIYRNLLKGKLTATERFGIIKDEQYDGLLCTGVISEDHVELKDAIPEFLRLLKDGAIAVYTISPTLDKTKALEEHLSHLYDGEFELLKLERKVIVEMNHINRDGVYHFYGIRKV